VHPAVQRHRSNVNIVVTDNGATVLSNPVAPAELLTVPSTLRSSPLPCVAIIEKKLAEASLFKLQEQSFH
jgi:hypothetical protein